MINWFARNSVAANLLMAFIGITGLIAGLSVRAQFFPDTSLGLISIDVPYLGAAPEEVEAESRKHRDDGTSRGERARA